MLLTNQNLLNFPEWLEKARTGEAFALIDKKKGWTSFDVIAKLRNITHIKKIGHAGTLDPLATGLLIVGFGRGTKRLSEFQDMQKEYEAEIKLGATTITDDAEADEQNIKPFDHLNDDEIFTAVQSFTGEIEQTPPLYSAKKVKGKRLYKYARMNQEVEIKPVLVEVHKIDVLKIQKPHIRLKILCSKGTYIRSLARDIGGKLGCGAYLSDLRRTAVGDFSAANAVTIDDIIEQNEKLKHP